MNLNISKLYALGACDCNRSIEYYDVAGDSDIDNNYDNKDTASAFVIYASKLHNFATNRLYSTKLILFLVLIPETVLTRNNFSGKTTVLVSMC